MKATLHDRAIFEALGPLELATYLRAHGWSLAAERERATVWLINPEFGLDFDALVPATRDVADYTLRVAELLQTLAKVEQRSELEIVKDMQSTTSDLLRLRAAYPGSDDGTLPLNLAVRFIEGSRDMMLAAACAAWGRRAVFGRRKPQLAVDYLSHVRMGQTEQGSYVVTILSPVAPALRSDGTALFEDSALIPFERKVTETLMRALAALSQAARKAAVRGDMTPFKDGVSEGISSNLCDAITGLAAVSPNQPLELRMSWAAHRPVRSTVAQHVTFDSDDIPVIEEAARQFRETEPVDDAEIEGFVTRLDREPKAQEGEVTVTASWEGQLLRIGIPLGQREYRVAVKAHDERLTVKCTGELVKEGRGYHLHNPRGFQITTHPTLF